MQLKNIIRWAKAKRKWALSSKTIPSLSGAIVAEFIETMLLPKLEEALHTSSNKRIKQGSKRPHAKRTS